MEITITTHIVLLISVVGLAIIILLASILVAITEQTKWLKSTDMIEEIGNQ